MDYYLPEIVDGSIILIIVGAVLSLEVLIMAIHMIIKRIRYS